MTNETIIELDIDKGIFRVMKKAIEREGKLTDLVSDLSVADTVTTPFLPANCVKWDKRGDLTIYVMHKPPGIEEVSTRVSLNNNELNFTNIKIIMPARLYFAPVFKGVLNRDYLRYVFVDAENARDLTAESILYNPWLPNTYNDMGRFCGGDGLSMVFRDMKNTGINTKLDAFVSYMDNSTFNDHVVDYVGWIDPKVFIPEDASKYGQYTNVDAWVSAVDAPPNHRLTHFHHLAKLHALTTQFIATMGERAAIRHMHTLLGRGIPAHRERFDKFYDNYTRLMTHG